MSRSQMLKRSFAAAAGLTVLASPGVALARARRGATPPAAQGPRLLAQGDDHGGEEGRPPQHDRAAARLGELRRDHVDLLEEVRHPDHERQPERQLGAGEPGDHARSRATRAHRTSSTSAPRSPSPGAAAGPLRASTSSRRFSTIPRAMKDTRGFWNGDYWGAISIGYNQNLITNAAEDVEGPAEAGVQGQGRAERQPAHVGLGGRRRLRGGARRTAARSSNVGPGIDFFAKLKQSGNFIPVGTTPQTVASGQTPISIDWDYNNLAYVEGVPGGAVEGRRSRPTASTAATTRRRSTRPLRIRGRRGSGRSSSTPTRVSSSG